MSDDFEPAFPTSVYKPACGGPGLIETYNAGMSMRDYFAAAALTGLLANAAVFGSRLVPAEMAAGAYNVADAMLARRDAPAEGEPC